MNAVVLYDSQWGNTGQIARRISEVLIRMYGVQTISAGDVNNITARPDLLVVGSPTHHRRPSDGIMLALRLLPDEFLDGVACAAFDTRYQRPRFLTGSAGLGIARYLSRRGARVEIGPESFFVVDKDGPLAEGELDRAHNWARQVLYLVTPNP